MPHPAPGPASWSHRIEGTGDKHVPSGSATRRMLTSMVIAIDDEACMSLVTSLASQRGGYLVPPGRAESLVSRLDLLGISGIANLLAAIKFAKWYGLARRTTWSHRSDGLLELYESRVGGTAPGRRESRPDAAADRPLSWGVHSGMAELGYWERRRIHNWSTSPGGAAGQDCGGTRAQGPSARAGLRFRSRLRR